MPFSSHEDRLAYAKAYYRSRVAAGNIGPRKSRAEEQRVWRKANPARTILNNAKRNAKAFNRPFDLTIDDIHIPDCCPVFGTPLVVGGPRADTPSIDRIRNEEGYVRGNVVIVSFRANAIKSNMSLAEMEKLVAFYRTIT